MQRRPDFMLPVIYPMLAVICIGLSGCDSGSGDQASDEDAPPPAANSRTLSIAPIAQQTELWCWAASAEMIFRYYQLPSLNSTNYQCGIVAVYFGPASQCWTNCFACVTGGGLVSQVKTLIDGYGTAANQLGTPSRILSSTLYLASLSFNETAEQIEAGQPVLAGITPVGYSYPNVSQHAVVIVGYQRDANGQRLIVNDPFPYERFPASPNPYLAAGGVWQQPGRYSILYSTFVSQLRWANTITNIR